VSPQRGALASVAIRDRARRIDAERPTRTPQFRTNGTRRPRTRGFLNDMIPARALRGLGRMTELLPAARANMKTKSMVFRTLWPDREPRARDRAAVAASQGDDSGG
jgi:hypothetical protein